MKRVEALDPRRLSELVRPLTGDPGDFDALVRDAAQKPYVLLGEATHGTHEFYRTRAEITKRLIREHGFSAIAIEGDFPDAHCIDRFVRCEQGTTPEEALAGFRRFPAWMWRNADMLEFVGWLRAFNDALPPYSRAAVFGLDLYSLNTSMHAVIDYLERIDPSAAQRAKERYSCFDRFGADADDYAASILPDSCKEEALAQLLEMQRISLRHGDAFYAEQNARIVARAEEYYRTMLDREISSWNLRDRFMFETLERLAAYLERKHEARAKIIVWAHNSHVGDARATSLGGGRELNLGQLVRQAHPASCRLIGFTTARGTVTAASNWREDAERKRVRDPLPASWESLFHETAVENFYLDLAQAARAHAPMRGRLLERAIGVVYRPGSEFYSHYFEARIAGQFDAVIHYDRTHAVEPLDRSSQWEAAEAAQTVPSGL